MAFNIIAGREVDVDRSCHSEEWSWPIVPYCNLFSFLVTYKKTARTQYPSCQISNNGGNITANIIMLSLKRAECLCYVSNICSSSFDCIDHIYYFIDRAKIQVYPHQSILMVIMAAGITYGVAALFTAGTAVGSFSSVLGRDETLTGRTEIWQQFLPMAMQRPY